MNRNQNSRFAYNPTNIDIGRSRFKRDSSVKFTFNVGELIPWYVDEVLPGDTFNVTTSKIVRLQTLLTPMMDNVYLDFYWFFVPNRLVWSHWKEFNGENTQSAWAPAVEYSIPQMYCAVDITGGTYDAADYIGSVADYMGVPMVDNSTPSKLSVNALPFRAYGLIYDEFFRSENIIDPENVITTDSNETFTFYDGDRNLSRSYKSYPYKVAKYFDYFTGALPAPQKGPAVGVPLEGFARVESSDPWFTATSGGNPYPLILGNSNGSGVSYTGGGSHNLLAIFNENASETHIEGSLSNIDTTSTSGVTGDELVPVNLWANLSEINGSVFSINELRMAFQVQKLLEKDARGGTRYIEILKSHFGVTSPDYRLQRPEYLGGNRIPLNINQVIQQSETSASSPMGNTAAMSVTSDIHTDFTKSFTEHGFIIGLCCARYDHTYQQGVERFWNRKTRYDYYWPVFANIGEQAILNKEIFAQGTDEDDEVFGYQEAWADYRYKPSRVAGEMRSDAPTSLDVWHLADDYSDLPTLSQDWLEEDGSTVDRVLAVTSEVSNQVFADVYVKNITTRAMPLYSIPGLIDHH